VISEPETGDGANDAEGGGGSPYEVVAAGAPEAAPGARRRWPWKWIAATAALTSLLWAAGVRAADRGDGPDLHGCRLTSSPCTPTTLKPLLDAFPTGARTGTPADLRRGSALDQATCGVLATSAETDPWLVQYDVTVTVELHKKTDPAVEFADRNHPTAEKSDPALNAFGGGPGYRSTIMVSADSTDHVVPVAHLGDKAYLLDGLPSRQTLTVLRGGAVLTLEVSATEQWTHTGHPSVDSSGHIVGAPNLSVNRFHPAMTATVKRLMDAL
jgi:hypothetical protein